MPQDTLEQRAVLWTQALVRVPSVSGSPACLQVLETARDLIESTGVEADIRILFPEAPNPVLLARTGRGKAGVPELMLSGHVDVVPPAGMEDPWSARIEGDRMHGRGTTDMKSGAACALTTFCEATRQGVDGVLWLILSTDEETAAQGVVRALGSPDAPRPQLCVICEPTGLCVRSAHRGDCWIRVDFTGKSAHSSRPHLGINAIEAAALFIVHAKKRLPELLAENAAAGPASSSIDLVSGGAAENVVPASASVTIDFRYQGVESAQVQCDRIEKILCEVRRDPDFPPVSTSLTVTGDWTALSTDMTQPLAQAAVAALGESLGHIPETTEMTGWGEGGSMQKFGIPAFYFGPGDGPLAHTPKESVSVSEIKTAVKALFHLVDRLVVHPKL